MFICGKGHAEVAYEDWDCPMCKLIEEHEKILNRQSEYYNNELDKFQDTLNHVTDQRDDYYNLLQIHHPELLI